MRRVEACIESQEDILSTYYKYTLSPITHKYFRTHVDVDIFSCFGIWNSYPKITRIFQSHLVSFLGSKFNNNDDQLSVLFFKCSNFQVSENKLK
jgi:hypothetical protein